MFTVIIASSSAHVIFFREGLYPKKILLHTLKNCNSPHIIMYSNNNKTFRGGTYDSPLRVPPIVNIIKHFSFTLVVNTAVIQFVSVEKIILKNLSNATLIRLIIPNMFIKIFLSVTATPSDKI